MSLDIHVPLQWKLSVLKGNTFMGSIADGISQSEVPDVFPGLTCDTWMKLLKFNNNIIKNIIHCIHCTLPFLKQMTPYGLTSCKGPPPRRRHLDLTFYIVGGRLQDVQLYSVVCGQILIIKSFSCIYGKHIELWLLHNAHDFDMNILFNQKYNFGWHKSFERELLF